MTLTEFLLLRIAEDEAEVDTAPDFVEDLDSARAPDWGTRACPICGHHMFDGSPVVTKDDWWDHVENYHRRTRQLAECDAKRRIVARHILGEAWDEAIGEKLGSCATCDYQTETWPCATLRFLGLPYADHVDFLPEWKP